MPLTLTKILRFERLYIYTSRMVDFTVRLGLSQRITRPYFIPSFLGVLEQPNMANHDKYHL